MKTPANPLTPEDHALFDSMMVIWQDRLNLRDWRIVRSARSTSSMADIKCDVTNRIASYRVGADFGGTSVTPASLEQTAVHELLHVLLAELVETAEAEGHTQEQVWAAEHRIINTLLNLLLPT